MVAIIPLWVALMDRAFFGRRLSNMAIAGLVVGFGGVALLVRPGGGGDVVAMLALVGTTAAWAGGSLYARGAKLPESPLLSASMQMLAASLFLGLTGLATGEASSIGTDSFATKPVIAFPYLVVVGSPSPSRQCVAAEERADLGGVDVRIVNRLSPSHSARRSSASRRAVDDRRRSRDRGRRRPDRHRTRTGP